MVLWLVPHYGLKQNPEPDHIPKLQELDLDTFEISLISSNDIRDFVQVNSEIKRVADKIVSISCRETSRMAFEYYKTPQESLSSNNGDCDDGSILLSSLLQSIGFRTNFFQDLLRMVKTGLQRGGEGGRNSVEPRYAS